MLLIGLLIVVRTDVLLLSLLRRRIKKCQLRHLMILGRLRIGRWWKDCVITYDREEKEYMQKQ